MKYINYKINVELSVPAENIMVLACFIEQIQESMNAVKINDYCEADMTVENIEVTEDDI